MQSQKVLIRKYSELCNAVILCLKVFAACASFPSGPLSGIRHFTKDILTTKEVAKDTKIR